MSLFKSGSTSATGSFHSHSANRVVQHVLPRKLAFGKHFRLLCIFGFAAGALAAAYGQADLGSVAVGTASTPQSVTVTAPAGGTVAKVRVMTVGIANLDFTDVNDTCASKTLVPNGNCTVTVGFKPTAAGLRTGAVVLLDGGNHTLGIAYLEGTGIGPLGVLIPGTMVDVAGSSSLTGYGDGGLATNATLRLPTSEVEDAAGNIYIADSDHNRIRKVTVTPGTLVGDITTISGGDAPGDSGDGGPAASATLNNPSGVAFDGAGNLYIADTGNNAIRKIDAFTGNISTIAGSPTGEAGFSGDGGSATQALLRSPENVTIDPAGNVYIADTLNQRIRMVDILTGNITTVVGDGNQAAPKNNVGPTATALNDPYDVAFDRQGNMYIADSGNNVIEEVSNGVFNVIVGTGVAGHDGDGGPALSARLHDPTGIAVDAVANIYIADTQNSGIRKVNSSDQTISRFAGTYTPGSSGNNGNALIATLYGPSGLYVDSSGNLLIADVFNNRVRGVIANLATIRIDTIPTRLSTVSLPQPETVEDIGTSNLNLTAITAETNAAIDAASTTCSPATILAVADDCNIGVEFAPTTVGDPLTGIVNVTGDTPNQPLVIQIIGDGTAQNTSTSTTLTSSPNPSLVLSSVTFTATVTGQDGAPTGTVTFTSDGKTIGTGTLNSTGTATLSTSALSIGTHTIIATYGGDSANSSSISASLSQVVQAIPTATVLVATLTANTPPQTQLIATVVATTGAVPTGSVQFMTGSTNLGTVQLTASGIATQTLNLAAGTYTVVATYSGDATHSPSSATLSVTITSGTSTPSSGFNLTTTPTSKTLATKQNATITVNLVSTNGFADTIELGCGGLPVAVTCTFASTSVNLAAGQTQKIPLTIDTGYPLSGGTQASNASHPHGDYFAAAIFMPLGGLFGFVLLRKRRRAGSIWTIVIFLCLTGSAFIATGCGGFTQKSAAPGTYTIQVIGAGQTTHATSVQNFTLTITQ